MNWNRITAYAAALFIAQITIGFLEGLFFIPDSTDAIFRYLIASSVVSFVVCGGIFAHLAARQPSRPFAHGMTALILQIAVASILARTLPGWLGNAPLVYVFINWMVLVCALLVGTAVGSSLRRGAGQSADA